jgi:phosphoglycolate phosphatase-like HAD superfamily hydrolase
VQSRYVIFDLDDTLVHSKAVRTAFSIVAGELGVEGAEMTSLLDSMPGRPAFEIFERLGLQRVAARAAAGHFLSLLHDLDHRVPTIAFPDAAPTLSALEASGSTLMLSTGSTPARAQRVLEQEGWDEFSLVLGSDHASVKGADHYEQIEAEASSGWATRAATVGDSPRDMSLGADFGVRVRIGVDRVGDASALVAAGATHVVRSLADILPILAVAA